MNRAACTLSPRQIMSLDMWKKLSHANVVQLRDAFNTHVFGDDSLVFVYDYHATAETIRAKHFSAPAPNLQSFHRACP